MKKLLALFLTLAFGMSVLGMTVSAMAASTTTPAQISQPAKKQHKHFKKGKVQQRSGYKASLTAN